MTNFLCVFLWEFWKFSVPVRLDWWETRVNVVFLCARMHNAVLSKNRIEIFEIDLWIFFAIFVIFVKMKVLMTNWGECQTIRYYCGNSKNSSDEIFSSKGFQVEFPINYWHFEWFTWKLLKLEIFSKSFYRKSFMKI